LIDFFVSVGHEAEARFATNDAAIEADHMAPATHRLAA